MKTKLIFIYLLSPSKRCCFWSRPDSVANLMKKLGLRELIFFIKGSYDGATNNVDGSYKNSAQKAKFKLSIFPNF
jgi:hypothetical protein